MRISDNPKLALTLLTAVFLAAFVLSLLTLGYSGGHTIVLQGTSVHVIYYHYVDNGTTINGTIYTSQPCVNHN